MRSGRSKLHVSRRERQLAKERVGGVRREEERYGRRREGEEEKERRRGRYRATQKKRKKHERERNTLFKYYKYGFWCWRIRHSNQGQARGCCELQESEPYE